MIRVGRLARTLALALALGSNAGCPKADTREPDEPAGDAAIEAHTRLAGVVVDHRGEPLRLAVVELQVVGGEPIRAEVGPQGRFELLGPARGFAWLRLTGVDHADFRLALLLDGEAHELSVALGTYPRPPSFAGLLGVAHFGDEQARETFEFAPDGAGKWRARLERDASSLGARELFYQLANATEAGHTINGTQADRFVYDGGGDYWSVIATPEGEGPVEIVFDPAALPPAAQPPRVEFGAPASSFTAIAQALLDVQAWQAKAWMGAGGLGFDHELFVLLRAKLRARIEAASSPALAAVYALGWLGVLDSRSASADEREFAATLVTVIGPGDPLWSLDPGALDVLLELAPRDAAERYATALLAEQADPTLVFALWLHRLDAAERRRDAAAAREAVAALRDPKFAKLGGRVFANLYDPERPTAPGKPVPDFAFRSLDGKTEYSAASLRGTTYVLEFWATWCAPCIAAMPALHQTYATLAERGGGERVEFLSVSLDDQPAAVVGFRADRWPMPWLHAHVPASEHAGVHERFGLAGIPTMVLVGPEGTILASTPTLEAETLLELLGE